MPITILLRRSAADRADEWLGDRVVSSFAPADLLNNHPLHPDHGNSTDPLAYGQRLFTALGGAALAEALRSLPRAPSPSSMVAIQADDAELATIPWELLHDGKQFLIFEYLLVREVPGAPLPDTPDQLLPWCLLAMGSDPLVQEVHDPDTGAFADYAPLRRLQVVRELDLIRDDLVRRTPPVPVRWQRIAPTRQALIDDLDPREPILFHYTGHGDVIAGQPVLCFDDGTGCMDPRPVADLAADLRGTTFCALLNACRTADGSEPGANLALALVENGVPAVVGTQGKVLDEGAAHFARTFYRSVAVGQHPAQAIYRARQQLKNQYRDQPREWAVPVLYLAAGYQWPNQRPPSGGQLAPTEPPAPETNQLRAPTAESQRFVGRDRELLDLARLFVRDRRQIVTIRGPGGQGKTALVNALAERLRWHFYDRIVAVTLFLPGNDAPLRAGAVRRTLAGLLGIDKHPAFDQPDADDEQDDVLVAALRGRQRMLLIWDNYETVLWRLGRERAAETDADADSAAPLAPDEADILLVKGRRLQLLRKQAAYFGPNADPAITMEIDDLSAELRAAPAHSDQSVEAAAVQRLVRRLADGGLHMLFTSRQSPVGLAGEVFYPPAEQGHQLRGLLPHDSEQLVRVNVGESNPSQAFLRQLGDAVGHSPLALQLAARRWASTKSDEAAFLANLRQELAQAHDPAAPMYQQSSVAINVRLSVDALPADLRANLLALTVIANPVIVPEHAAVIWDVREETDDSIRFLDEQAQSILDRLHDASLLQGQGYDDTHGRASAYSFQPVIAGVLAGMVDEVAQAHARERYARWADMVISRAYDDDTGIDANADVAQATQFLLPDLAVAIRHLPAERRGWAAWQASWVFERFGQPDLASEHIAIAEAVAEETNDQKLLALIYHQQADLLVTRGELEAAMGAVPAVAGGR